MRMICFLLLLGSFQACAQKAEQTPKRTHSQRCEGCEAVRESPVPFTQLNNTDTFPDFLQQGPRMLITGVVYKPDGKTPAPGVVIYAYHTDQTGIYPTNSTSEGWGKRHGYLRGWVRTDKDGRYYMYTLRPASYPNRTDPAHIHMTVKEPDMAEYWIDDVVFEDDPFVTAQYKSRLQNGGGDGVVKAVKKGDLILATRDIILGKNISGYN